LLTRRNAAASAATSFRPEPMLLFMTFSEVAPGHWEKHEETYKYALRYGVTQYRSILGTELLSHPVVACRERPELTLMKIV
jgi:hypothetical protein